MARAPLVSTGDVAAWNVKEFSVPLREAITRAAKEADCTVADWLHGYFRQHGIDGEVIPVEINQVIQPSNASAGTTNAAVATPTPSQAIATLIEAACRLAAARGLRRELRMVAEGAIVQELRLYTGQPPEPSRPALSDQSEGIIR